MRIAAHTRGRIRRRWRIITRQPPRLLDRRGLPPRSEWKPGRYVPVDATLLARIRIRSIVAKGCEDAAGGLTPAAGRRHLVDGQHRAP